MQPYCVLICFSNCLEYRIEFADSLVVNDLGKRIGINLIYWLMLKNLDLFLI